MDFLKKAFTKKEFQRNKKIRKFSIKTYEDTDYEELANLYQIIFPHLNSKDLIEWKNRKNPYEKGDSFTFLMKDKNKVIAQYTVTPLNFYIFGRKFPCVQSGGTMTHPNYQGLGISTFLGNLTYEYSKRKGYFFVYGFPNKSSIYMFEKKLGWTNFGNMNLFIKEIPSKIYHDKIIDNYNIQEIKSFDEKINVLWNKIKFFIPITIKKDREFLNWRYVEHPNKYKKFYVYDEKFENIVAYFVLKRYKDNDQNTIGHIVDFFIDPRDKLIEKEIFELIEKYSYYDFKEDCSKISLWLPNSNLEDYVLKKLDYKLDQMEIFFGYKIFREHQKLNILKYYRNWYITMSYSDTF